MVLTSCEQWIASAVIGEEEIIFLDLDYKAYHPEILKIVLCCFKANTSKDFTNIQSQLSEKSC